MFVAPHCGVLIILYYSLLRCPDFLKRKVYVKLVDDVRDSGGDVKIFSTMHVSGERELRITVWI